MSEQRYLSRLLCTDAFEDCTVHIGDKAYQVEAVNFHREGIAISSPEIIPHSSDELWFSFAFNHKNLKCSFPRIPLTIHYSLELEIGSQYGCAFSLEKLSSESKRFLTRVEHILQQYQSGDRYGVFSS